MLFDPTKNLASDPRPGREIVAAVICNNDLIDDMALSSDHFEDPTNKRIWLAIEGLHEGGKRVDEITLRSFLNDQENDALANMIEERGDQSAIPFYAEMLRAAHKRRHLTAIGIEMPVAASDQSVDPDNLIAAYQDRLDELRDPKSVARGWLAGEATNRVLQDALEAKRSGTAPGIRTGIASLDEILLPLKPGQSVTCAAGTSQGKTAFAVQVAANVAKRGTAVSFFTLEMTANELGQRFLAHETGVPVESITSGNLSEYEIRLLTDADERIQAWPLKIEPRSRLTVPHIERLVRQHKRKYDTQLVIVDYLGLLNGKGKDFYQKTTDLTRDLKIAAGALNVPILTLAQLNRENERRVDNASFKDRYLRRRPRLSDLRDSGSIEQDSDIVIFLHREELYLRREEPPFLDEKRSEWSAALNDHVGKIDIILAKQRQAKIGLVTCPYDDVRFRFGEVSRS